MMNIYIWEVQFTNTRDSDRIKMLDYVRVTPLPIPLAAFYDCVLK